jgi:DhnA family fructose-bisphosphate aldolase class Ia
MSTLENNRSIEDQIDELKVLIETAHAKCVAEAGVLGMIVGRKVFQRKPAEAKELLKEIHTIFADA